MLNPLDFLRAQGYDQGRPNPYEKPTKPRRRRVKRDDVTVVFGVDGGGGGGGGGGSEAGRPYKGSSLDGDPRYTRQPREDGGGGGGDGGGGGGKFSGGGSFSGGGLRSASANDVNEPAVGRPQRSQREAAPSPEQSALSIFGAEEDDDSGGSSRGGGGFGHAGAAEDEAVAAAAAAAEEAAARASLEAAVAAEESAARAAAGGDAGAMAAASEAAAAVATAAEAATAAAAESAAAAAATAKAAEGRRVLCVRGKGGRERGGGGGKMPLGKTIELAGAASGDERWATALGPVAANRFQVRDYGYAQSKMKQPSGEALFALAGADCVASVGPISDFSARVKLPRLPAECDPGPSHVPPYFVVNMQIPMVYICHLNNTSKRLRARLVVPCVRVCVGVHLSKFEENSLFTSRCTFARTRDQSRLCVSAVRSARPSSVAAKRRSRRSTGCTTSASRPRRRLRCRETAPPADTHAHACLWIHKQARFSYSTHGHAASARSLPLARSFFTSTIGPGSRGRLRQRLAAGPERRRRGVSRAAAAPVVRRRGEGPRPRWLL